VFLIRSDLGEARRIWLQSFQDARQREEAERSDFLTYRDSQGRYADFHALRHTFINMLGRLGLSTNEQQDLARHSTYAVTAQNTHSRLYELAAAVERLPIPVATAQGPDRQALPATGTDGRPISLGPYLGPPAESSGDFARRTETDEHLLRKTKNPE